LQYLIITKIQPDLPEGHQEFGKAELPDTVVIFHYEPFTICLDSFWQYSLVKTLAESERRDEIIPAAVQSSENSIESQHIEHAVYRF